MAPSPYGWNVPFSDYQGRAASSHGYNNHHSFFRGCVERKDYSALSWLQEQESGSLASTHSSFRHEKVSFSLESNL